MFIDCTYLFYILFIIYSYNRHYLLFQTANGLSNTSRNVYLVMIGWYYIIIVIQSNPVYTLIDQFVTDAADLLQEPLWVKV
jgi:hypothetical protein